MKINKKFRGQIKKSKIEIVDFSILFIRKRFTIPVSNTNYYFINSFFNDSIHKNSTQSALD